MKTETRGRKPLTHPSTKVSWSIPYEIYNLLLTEQKKIETDTGVKPLISQVAQAVLKRGYNL